MKEKLANLEGWRGVLSLFVCISHAFQLLAPKTLWGNSFMNLWGNLSHFSVIAFFFISGIVIFYSLSIRFKHDNSFISYSKARFLRIYPPFIGLIFILIILRFLVFKLNLNTIKSEFGFNNLDVLYSSIMVKLSLGKVNAPLWSLLLEWWFYFIGYFIVLGITSKSIFIKFFSIVLIVLNYHFLLSVNSNTTIYLIIWLMGGLYFVFFDFLYRTKIFVIIGVICIIYLVFIANVFFQKFQLSNHTFHQLLCILMFSSLWCYLPKLKTLKLLAESSYSLYILHYPFFLFTLGICNLYSFNLYYVLPTSILLLIILAHYYALIFENRTFLKKINLLSKS
jgi:peptidoglycan/LPS O-acetylase OafA/YrhL